MKDLIEQLSKDHEGLASSTEGINVLIVRLYCMLTVSALDPKPYIRTFEAALHELQRIHTSLSAKETQLAREAEESEKAHCHNVIQISRNFGVSWPPARPLHS